jgi:hypothetical protein
MFEFTFLISGPPIFGNLAFSGLTNRWNSPIRIFAGLKQAAKYFACCRRVCKKPFCQGLGETLADENGCSDVFFSQQTFHRLIFLPCVCLFVT